MIQVELPAYLLDLFDESSLAESMSTPPRARGRQNYKSNFQRSSSLRQTPQHLPHHRTGGGFRSAGNSLSKLFEAALSKAAAEQNAEQTKSTATAAAKPLTTTTAIARSDLFTKQFDLRGFKPEETTVKVDGNTLIVEGKHEVKSEDGTYEFREYRSRCPVPESVLLEKIKCKVGENDQLIIEAPFKPAEEEKPTVRTIPIEFVSKRKPAPEPVEEAEMTLD